MTEFNTKQTCTLSFVVYNKVCIVTVINSDVSGVIIPIDINLWIQQAFLDLYTRLRLKHTELW